MRLVLCVDTTEVGSFFREIHQERGEHTGRLQVRPHLCIVGFAKFFNGLQLQNYLIFNHQVQPVPTHFLATVVDDDLLFDLDTQASALEFDYHSPSIYTLDEAWTEFLMDFDNALDDKFRK